MCKFVLLPEAINLPPVSDLIHYQIIKIHRDASHFFFNKIICMSLILRYKLLSSLSNLKNTIYSFTCVLEPFAFSLCYDALIMDNKVT
jgi:hypothetical protein